MESEKRYYVRHYADSVAFDILTVSRGLDFENLSTRSWIICKRDSAGNPRITKGEGSIAGVVFFREMMSAHEVSCEQYVRALEAALTWTPPRCQEKRK